MALRTPPSWLQNGSHPAENDRLTMQAIFATSGVIGASSLQVGQASPLGLSVSIAAGWAAIVGDYTTNMGVYTIYNDAPMQVSVTAADSANPRIDLVVATVNDAYYTGLTNNVTFTVVAGVPAGSPVAPAVPSNSLLLAQVAVAAGAISIVNANITDGRTAATSLSFAPLVSPAFTGIPTVPTAAAGTSTTQAASTAFVQSTTSQALTTPALTYPVLTSPQEVCTVSAAAAAGAINFDCATQGVLFYTTAATANFTLNFRWDSGTSLAARLAVGDSLTIVFLNTNGATPYYPTAFTIDGVAVTPKWSGTAPTAGDASALDAYSFTIIKTAATPTYTVLASAVKFA